MCVRDFVLGSMVGLAVGLTAAPVIAEAQTTGIREVSASERSLIPLQTRLRYTTLVVLPEGEEIIDKGEDDEVIAAGLLAGAQAVEHYEISRYGTMIAWAEQLGHNDAVPLLKATLKEEKAADAKLNDIAMTSANREAA